MKEGWAKTLFLSKKLDRRFDDMENKINSVIIALTNITLSIKGVGAGLIGTSVEVTDGNEKFTGIFDANLRLTFQLTNLGTYSIKYQHTETQVAVEQVVISDYGYVEATVNYFPGYDLWEYWADLAGINTERFPSAEQMLRDDLARLSLMSSVNAINYMFASEGGLISGAVLNSADTVKNMLRSPYAVQKLKESAYWRNALLNNAVAGAACYSIRNELKSKTLTVNTGGYGCPERSNGSKTSTLSIEDANMFLIFYTYHLKTESSDALNADGDFAYSRGAISINGTLTIERSQSAWKKGSYASAETETVLLYNKQSIIQSISATIFAEGYGTSYGGTVTGAFYYL